MTTGTPQWEAGLTAGRAEGYDKGYNDGFADGANDAAPGLLDAAKAYLAAEDASRFGLTDVDGPRAALRLAIAEAVRVQA